MKFSKIKFDANGLIPVIIQDATSNCVLMLAYMNAVALKRTLTTGTTWFYSRSRKCLWNKGASSGNKQLVRAICYDCDGDAILISVDQLGVACHTGAYSCFKQHKTIRKKHKVVSPLILSEVFEVIVNRKNNHREKSYTSLLFKKGIDYILKKIGEESAETIIASKNSTDAEVVYEMSDLLYHCMVLLSARGIPFNSVLVEMAKRRNAKHQNN